jgi:hypothetical protein
LSRLRKLRSFWRSVSRKAGTPRVGGYRKPYAFTTAKGHGVRILETVTLEDSSSFFLHGLVSVDGRDPILLPLASSYSAHGLSTGATATRGVSGEPLGSAD